jgi:hypothetical protein
MHGCSGATPQVETTVPVGFRETYANQTLVTDIWGLTQLQPDEFAVKYPSLNACEKRYHVYKLSHPP